MYARKKISRYVDDILPIYRVSEGINTIFHGEIFRRNFERNPQKSAISRDISMIYQSCRFFPIYHMVNAGKRSQTRYSAVTVHLPFTAEGIFGLGFNHLPSGLTSPMIYNVQKIYIYLNSV